MRNAQGNRGWAAVVAVIVTALTAAVAAPAQTFTTLLDFNSKNGGYPYFGPLVQGTDGNLYGATTYGGNNCPPFGCGTIFKMSPAGILTTIYSFCQQAGCADGTEPYAGIDGVS